jgi:hypothetical protein
VTSRTALRLTVMPQTLAGHRHSVLIGANDFAGQFDFLSAAYVWCAVDDQFILQGLR